MRPPAGEGGPKRAARPHPRPNPLSPLGVTLLGLAAALQAGPAAPQDDAVLAARRTRMVVEQIAARGVRDPLVLKAMAEVPRHLFVPPGLADRAYADHPLPIAEGQTISQPYIVALMTECLALRGGEKILEVGTGSGYQAAVLGRIAGSVFTIEIHEPLSRAAGETLRRLGYRNVTVRSGDGFFGWPEQAPFDGVVVTCAAAEVPPALFAQLAEGGRLVLPLGDPGAYQELTVVTKRKGKPAVERVLDVRFVPMTGEIQKKKSIRMPNGPPGPAAEASRGPFPLAAVVPHPGPGAGSGAHGADSGSCPGAFPSGLGSTHPPAGPLPPRAGGNRPRATRSSAPFA